MRKQGGWWLQALVQFDPYGEALLYHRVTGEVALGRGPPNVSAGCVWGEGGGLGWVGWGDGFHQVYGPASGE